MHFCNCKYKRSLVLSPLRSLLIFHSLPRWALAPPSSTVKKKKRKLLQEILYWIEIIEWECKEQKRAVHGGGEAAGVCDVSDLRSACYCIMAGSAGSLGRGHCWSVPAAASLTVTLRRLHIRQLTARCSGRDVDPGCYRSVRNDGACDAATK